MNKIKKTCKNEKCEYISLNNHDTYFYSDNLYFVAFLITIGFELISLDRQNLQKAFFVIKRNLDLEEKLNECLFGQSRISAREFSKNVKLLEDKIYR